MALNRGCKSLRGSYWRKSNVNSSCTRWADRVPGLTVEPARGCGMEAGSEAQHRTKVNPCAGRTTWVSVLRDATPDIQSWSYGSGGGGGAKLRGLTPGDLLGSAMSGRGACEGTPTPGEKSDRLIVAMKPGNAGGAKGATV